MCVREEQMAAIKGLVGRKIGMTQVWNDKNEIVPVTVVEAGPCYVVQVKTNETDGYSAIQVSFGENKSSRLTKPELGHLEKAGLGKSKASSNLTELRLASVDGIEVGQRIQPGQFAPGEIVDVTGISKGKGFAGTIKRHNFSGQGNTHGNHGKHRTPGSIGACAAPARVFKGKKMAGQLGSKRITTQNLEVIESDNKAGTLLIKGAIPGPKGGIVIIKNAAKRPDPAGFNFEDIVEEIEEVHEENVTDEESTSPEINADSETGPKDASDSGESEALDSSDDGKDTNGESDSKEPGADGEEGEK